MRVLANPGEKKNTNQSLCLVHAALHPPTAGCCQLQLMERWTSTASPHVPAQGWGAGVCSCPSCPSSAGSAASSLLILGLSPAGGVTRTPQTGDGAHCWDGGAHPRPSGSCTLSLLQTRSPLLLPRPYRITQDKCKSLFVPEE